MSFRTDYYYTFAFNSDTKVLQFCGSSDPTGSIKVQEFFTSTWRKINNEKRKFERKENCRVNLMNTV